MFDATHERSAMVDMRNRFLWPLLTALCLAGLVQAATAQTAQGIKKNQWTRFRGPNGSGISDAKTIPTTWTAEDYNWSVKLPGQGSSSPVVWRDRLFLTSNDTDKSVRSILCVNTKDGAIRWKRDFPYQKYSMHRDNDFASSTPTVDADGVVVVWSTPKQLLMLALDLCSDFYILRQNCHPKHDVSQVVYYGSVMLLAIRCRTKT